MLSSIEFLNILPFVLFVALLSNSFAFYCSILLYVWHALIKKLSNRWMLGKKIYASSFSFPHPENCHIIFVFSCLFFPQPWKLSDDAFMLWIKSILILSLITLCVNCQCFICLPCSVPSFFLWQVFLFAFYLEQHPIVCPSSLESRVVSPYPIVHWSVSSTLAVVITEHAELHGI